MRIMMIALLLLAASARAQEAPPEDGPGTVPTAEAPKVLLWGDTHLHTLHSFDAYLNGNRSVDPDTAYRFARGEPVVHPFTRTRVQIGTPLDFLVVSDHAEFYGGMVDIYERGIQDPDPGPIDSIVYFFLEWFIRDAIDEGEAQEYFADLLPEPADATQAASEWVSETDRAMIPGAEISMQNAWRRMLEAAEHHNQPGEFTSLIGWEWTSNPGGANLHRIVVTDASEDQAARFLPFGSQDSPYPEDLWAWMAQMEGEIGARFLSIPHNSNISRDLMFGRNKVNGDPVDTAHATASARWEPIMEVTQIKGDSEADRTLSPDDPFAGFEPYPYYHQNQTTTNYVVGPGDFARSALRQGMEMERVLGVNPYQFGMIGSTDSHTGLATAEEPNFWGKMALDSTPERKQNRALGRGPSGWTMQAGGLAAVYAEENTREAILDAFVRREVYATTGPRIVLQFRLLHADGSATAMGGEYDASDEAPTFDIEARRDPVSGNLDRIQVVKGWLNADGSSDEQVFDVVWSGDREPVDGVLPPVGDTVDRRTGAYENSIGAPVLRTQWQDPQFDAGQQAFYYARVLEIPTPRHSYLDAIAMGMERATEGPDVIQERAYSSPIWQYPRAD